MWTCWFLVELLLHHCNGALKHVKRLDFTIASRSSSSSSNYATTTTNGNNDGGVPSTNGGGGKRGIRSHGAYALSRVLLISNYIEEVYLVGNRIGPYGASAIFDAIASNNNNNSMNNNSSSGTGGGGSAVKTLLLRGCRIGERGALAFVNRILVNELEYNKLRIVDLSACRMGFRGTYAIEARLRELSERTSKHVIRSYSTLSTLHDEFNAMVVGGSSSSLDNNDTSTTTNGTNKAKVMMIVDLEGNLVYQEVMNCVTHGLGIILGTVGQLLLNKQIVGQPWYYIVSCAIYSTSVITLYMSSTLYHSFFALRRVKFIFGVFDKCAIYLLIAGSYTPFLMIGLHHKQSISMKLLLFIWGCAISGIYVEMFYHSWKYKSNFSLAMYLGMGWCCLTCMPDIVEVLPRNALVLLVAGGVSYTGGVPFFIRNTNLDHSIWHMFVLAGKKCVLFLT
jgi:hemolysin III